MPARSSLSFLLSIAILMIAAYGLYEPDDRNLEPTAESTRSAVPSSDPDSELETVQ